MANGERLRAFVALKHFEKSEESKKKRCRRFLSDKAMPIPSSLLCKNYNPFSEPRSMPQRQIQHLRHSPSMQSEDSVLYNRKGKCNHNCCNQS